MSERHLIHKTRSYKTAKLHTGEVIHGLGRNDLRKRVLARLLELGVSVPNLERYFENSICDAMCAERAARDCRFIDNETPEHLRKERVLRADDVWRFVKAMTGWLSAGGGLDAPEVAEARAAVCAQCPRNVEVSGCRWCSGIAAAAVSLLAGRTTTHDPCLKHCDVCGCDNRAAVHFPLAAADTSLDYPAWCWKNHSPK